MHIPLNWQNKNYVLQYNISNEVDWLAAGTVFFAYHGSRGHVHGDSFDTSDSNHPHGDNFSGSDSGHNH